MYKKSKPGVAFWGSIIAVVLAVIVYGLLHFVENRVPVLESGGESTPSSGILNYDFRADGLVVQTEQHGDCRIQVVDAEQPVMVYVTGKNLCGGVAGTPLPKEYNGVTYSASEDGGITVTGTAAKTSICYVTGRLGNNTKNSDRLFLPEGTYTFSGCPDGGSSSTYRMRLMVVDSLGEVTYYNDDGDGVTFSLSEAAYVATAIQIFDGTIVDNLHFAPQIEVGTEATEYESYRAKKYVVTRDIDIELPDTSEFYTFMSTGGTLVINGFGTVKNCIKPIYHADQPHFAIIDDDGKDEVYSILMPLLNNRGIKFSTSLIPTRLNEPGYLTVEEVQKIVEAGNKVMCHSKSHKNLKNEATTYNQRYDEIVGGKKMLADLGFEVDTMVYPNGSYDDEVLGITKSAYKYGVSTSGETTWGQQRYNEDPINQYVIERINIGSYYSGQTAEEKAQALEDAKKNIDVCIEKNYLCVIMTHIADAGEDGIAQIVELIDYIEQKGYKIDDFDTAVEAHLPPDES